MTSNLQSIWKEIVIGLFFVTGLFASVNVDPEGTIFQTLVNMSQGTSVHSAEVSLYNDYLLISWGVLLIGVIACFAFASYLGIISVLFAYLSGFTIEKFTIPSLILLGIAWICLLYGHKRRK